jgi:hypothetical protein
MEPWPDREDLTALIDQPSLDAKERKKTKYDSHQVNVGQKKMRSS